MGDDIENRITRTLKNNIILGIDLINCAYVLFK